MIDIVIVSVTVSVIASVFGVTTPVKANECDSTGMFLGRGTTDKLQYPRLG